MSNHEFARAVVDAWAEGLNTVEIAKRLGRTEAEIANMLGRIRGAAMHPTEAWESGT